MKKDFETFKSGDVVTVKRGFPYVNHVLLDGELYTIDKMLSAAGVVTLKGLPYNKTFPDGAFELVRRIDDEVVL
jgi:hypothetical protein